MAMEISKVESTNIEIHDEPTNNHDDIIKEWEDQISGKGIRQLYESKRRIEKVPPLLLKGKKGRKNKRHYEPAVVSLGPYHHNKNDLHLAENYKRITLEEYVSDSHNTIDVFYHKVFEVIHIARKCYIDDSTKDYNDEQFTLMMMRDRCFVLFFIECVSHASEKIHLTTQYLGGLGVSNIIHDIFLLENQIPFVVLQVLMNLRFPDNGEGVLNGFFSFLNYAKVIRTKENFFGKSQPLHLLELYREYFFSLSLFGKSASSTMWPKNNTRGDHFNYEDITRSFSSVMELKAKGIFVKRTHVESSEEIKFHSRGCYGELELVCRVVSSNAKAIYLNMIAYEMCPHNPNDFRVSTYIRFMKWLIVHRDDVKELRAKNILIHSLGRDEEVVKLYDDIATPVSNLFMLNQLTKGIDKHCTNKCKTWMAELITVYFSSPWKAMALLVACAIFFTSFLQTYFTIRPLPDNSDDHIIRLLKKCVNVKPPSTLT